MDVPWRQGTRNSCLTELSRSTLSHSLLLFKPYLLHMEWSITRTKWSCLSLTGFPALPLQGRGYEYTCPMTLSCLSRLLSCLGSFIKFFLLLACHPHSQAVSTRAVFSPRRQRAARRHKVKGVLRVVLDGVALPLKDQVRGLAVLLDPVLLLNKQVAGGARSTYYQLWLWLACLLWPYLERRDLASVTHALLTYNNPISNAFSVGLPLKMTWKL